MYKIGNEQVKSSRNRGFSALQIHGHPTMVDITEAELEMQEFTFALFARSSRYRGAVLGYSVMGPSPLLTLEPTFLELRVLKVDSTYFGSGVGKLLLGHSKELSQEKGQRLILQPYKPGNHVTEYPLTSEQLKAMYLRNGFRDFTPDEVDNLATRMDDAYLSARLWMEGINPVTARLTEDARDFPTLEEVASLSDIPFKDKLRLLTEISNVHSFALNGNRDMHRRVVKKYIVVE
jgi:GNAT superfamily N-acetyltransferase